MSAVGSVRTLAAAADINSEASLGVTPVEEAAEHHPEPPQRAVIAVLMVVGADLPKELVRLGLDPEGDEQALRNILRSHDPWAPCRHGGAHEAETLWSMIGLPREGKLLVAPGPPCRHDYVEHFLPA